MQTRDACVSLQMTRNHTMPFSNLTEDQTTQIAERQTIPDLLRDLQFFSFKNTIRKKGMLLT